MVNLSGTKAWSVCIKHKVEIGIDKNYDWRQTCQSWFLCIDKESGSTFGVEGELLPPNQCKRKPTDTVNNHLVATNIVNIRVQK